jgi:hypothetical protein
MSMKPSTTLVLPQYGTTVSGGWGELAARAARTDGMRPEGQRKRATTEGRREEGEDG